MKSRVFPLVALVCLAALLSSNSGFAQGTAFTYQGQLSVNGGPANGRYDFLFAVYDNATGGSQQGLGIATNGVPVTNGLFSVSLDFGNVFPGASRWLSISARTNGTIPFTTLSPRQELTSTPYAITAVTAASVRPGGITSGMLAQGAVTTDKIAAGAVKAAQFDDQGVGQYESLLREIRFVGGAEPLAFAKLRAVSQTNTLAPTITLTVDGSPVGAVMGFSGWEGLSESYTYAVSVRTTIVLDPATRVGLVARMTFTRNNRTTSFSGIVTGATRSMIDGGGNLYTFRIESPLAAEKLSTDYRIFQRITVSDVVNGLLGAVTRTLNLQGTFPVQDNFTQYGESDFNFASRLMEDHGIFYFFDQWETGPRLVLGNHPGAYLAAPATAFLYFGNGDVKPPAGAEYISEFGRSAWQTTGKTTLGAYHFQVPGNDLQYTSTGPRGIGEKYEFGVPLQTGFPADVQKAFQTMPAFAAIRQGRNNMEAVVLAGASSIPDLRPGQVITLSDQTAGGFSGAYVVTKVRHSAFVRTLTTSQYHYGNEFEAIPAATLFRPTRTTPKPQAQPCTAVVTGPPGETKYVDEYGRIKVKFHWDRSTTADENSSAFLRMTTLGAGQNRGIFWLPEVGDEVLVSFLMGDPDQPVVVGSLYNAALMPPMELPAKRLTTAMRTTSTGGGENEIIMDDTPGRESVQIHSSKSLILIGGEELNLAAANRIDLSGPIRVNGGTYVTNLVSGQLLAGSSTTGSKQVTITFPKTFLSPPRVLITAQNDPGFNNVADTFVATVRSVSTSSCVVNIVRVDSNAGWSQNLRLNWMAWE